MNSLRHFLLLTIGVYITNSCFAQAGLFNDADLTVQSGSTLYVQNVINTDKVLNSGTIRVTGDFDNSGTQDVGGLVVLEGSANQSVSGTTRFFGVLEVDKTGGTATVSSGTTYIDSILRLNSGIINANGNLVIASTPTRGTGLVDDFSNVSYNGSLTGNLRVQRHVSSGGFHYIGSAVNSAQVSELSELNLYGPDGGQIIPQPDCSPNAVDFSSPYGNLFEWHQNGPFTVPGCTQSGWFVRSGGQMTNGRGYAAIVNGGGATLEIGGNVGNTSETSNVSYSGLVNSNQGLPNADGWHLVSNPFPSPMRWNMQNWNDITSLSGGVISGSVARFVASGTYQGTYQSTSTTADPFFQQNGFISSMQGFFIKVVSGTVNWTLPQSVRVLGDPTFAKVSWENMFSIVVEGEGFADMTSVYFGDQMGETTGFDLAIDAHKLQSKFGQPTLFTRIGSDNYSINNLPIEGHPMTVPMDLTPGVSGTFKFRAEHLSSFDIEAHVYLEDLKVGTIQELTINPVYEFTADENDDAERFLLHFRLNGEDPMYTGEDILMYANNGSAYVFLPEFDGKTQFDVFNALGDLVYTKSNLYEGKNTFDLSQLATGAYVFRLMVNDKPFSKKVIL
jgi:hypothetical protein